jgi:hypothetical protein
VFDNGQFKQFWDSHTIIFTNQYAEAVKNLTADERNELRKLMTAGTHFKDPIVAAKHDKKLVDAALALQQLFDEMYETTAEIIASTGGQKYLENRYIKRRDYYPRVWDRERILANREGFVQMLMDGAGLEQKAAVDLLAKLEDGQLFDMADDTDVSIRPGVAGSIKERVLPDVIPGAEEFTIQSMDVAIKMHIRQSMKTAAVARFFGGEITVTTPVDVDLEGPSTDKASPATQQQPFWWPTAKINRELNTAYAFASTRGAFVSKKDGKAVIEDDMRPEDIDYLALKTFPALLGRLGQDIDPTLRRWMVRTQAILNMLFLPFSTLSSFPDLAGVLIRSRDVSMAYEGLYKALSSGNRQVFREQAALLGFINEKAVELINSQMYNEGYTDDPLADKINHYLFKWNGQNKFTEFTRVIATATAISWLKDRHARARAGDQQAIDDLKPFLPVRPASLLAGIQKYSMEDVLEAMDALAKVDYNLVELHNLAKASRLNPVANEHLIPHRQHDQIARDVVAQFVNESVLNPHAAHRPTWASDPRWMLFFHLKQFAYSFHRVILNRIADDFVRAYANNGADGVDIRYALSTVAYASPLLALAAAGLAARNVAQYSLFGEEPPEDRTVEGGWDYFTNVVQRAGLLGVGQFLVDVDNNVDRGNFGLLAPFGPTVNKVSDFIQASEEEGNKWGEGKSNELIKLVPPMSWLPALRQQIIQDLDH